MTNGNINFFDPLDSKDVDFLDNFKDIILKSIEKINLDLSNFVVLTEAATGNWISTPIIAALANSKKVLCFTKDSEYGTVNDIMKNFAIISKYFNLENVLHVFDDKTSPLISEADIITNSGLLRPLDKNFIKSINQNSVISLMWEPWEFRDTEINLQECWRKQIPILGVNEHNSIMDIMKYDADAILKIINENNFSTFQKNIVIVGENISSLRMYDKLKSLNANISFVTQLLSKECKEQNIQVIGKSLNDENVFSILKQCDILIINTIPIQNMIIGDGGISPQKLKELKPNISIFVYFGNVDYNKIKDSNLQCFPSMGKNGGYMNWTVDILGPRPTIELNTLGLKVGEILAKNRNNSKFDTEKKSLTSNFCLDFSSEQKLKYYNF